MVQIIRRLLVTTAATLATAAALSAAPSAAYAETASLMPMPPQGRAGDHLTVTVQDTGVGADGTFEVYCHPADGSHPDPKGACHALDRRARWGTDLFAPVPDDSSCTMQYGGPATAHVTGTWAGRPIDATYDRSNGCQIARWDRLVPLLPDLQ